MSPPEEPCNICKHGSEYYDVMSAVEVDYGGSKAPCGQIFNALFSREEQNSDTCSLVAQDLAAQCCYDKCSLCGDLQTNTALSVDHDGTKIGCSDLTRIFSPRVSLQKGRESAQLSKWSIGRHAATMCHVSYAQRIIKSTLQRKPPP